MPVSFMSLLGGLVSLVGTSTNIIMSQVRRETLGNPFAMFDFAPVGLSLTAIGFVFVSIGWRLLPHDRQGREALENSATDAAYSTEARILDDLGDDLKTIGDLDLGNDGVTLSAIERVDGKRMQASANAPLVPDEILILEGDDDALARMFVRLPLLKVRADDDVAKAQPNEAVHSLVERQFKLVRTG